MSQFDPNKARQLLAVELTQVVITLAGHVFVWDRGGPARLKLRVGSSCDLF